MLCSVIKHLTGTLCSVSILGYLGNNFPFTGNNITHIKTNYIELDKGFVVQFDYVILGLFSVHVHNKYLVHLELILKIELLKVIRNKLLGTKNRIIPCVQNV